MKRSITTGIALLSLLSISGCDRGAADGPPALRLGKDVCDQCNMIISDVRWATATIVEGPRGPDGKLFDDFNCQVNYEIEHKDLIILGRWSHDHATNEWISTSEATFLIAENLRTPMGSRMIAFGRCEGAVQASQEAPGEVLDFENAWHRLGYPGSPRADQHRSQDDGVP